MTYQIILMGMLTGVLLGATMVDAREYPCQTSEHTVVAATKSDMELMWTLASAKDEVALTKLLESQRIGLVKPGLPIYVKGDEGNDDAMPMQYGQIRFEGVTEYVWTSMALIHCPAKTPDEATPEPTPPAQKQKGR
jgi:hypothetical protein